MDRFVTRKSRAAKPEESEERSPKKSYMQLQKENGEEVDQKPCFQPIVNKDSGTSPKWKQDEKTSLCLHGDFDYDFPDIKKSSVTWKKISRDNLDLDYAILFPRRVADALVRILEQEVDYFTGDMAKLHIFGKWQDIPRKQATYGDPGLTYKYSGKVTPARPWPRSLSAIRDLVSRVSGHSFNFVLVNRYKDGTDRMGEHKDDEKELDSNTPIASVSLGQPRDFYFKHQDSRAPLKKNIDKVNMVLEHGSLLLMNSPTNRYWYHALPPRKSVHGLRINLTFRKILKK